MARPATIADDTILDAARALFAEKGARSTTAEIAARAGVSEGTLFKRFGNKGALLKAAMSSTKITAWIEQQMRGQAPLRTEADFVRFVRWQAAILHEVVPVVLMSSSWSPGDVSRTESEASRVQSDQLRNELTGPKAPPFVAIRTLASMLEAEMEAGHLARRNADAAARIVIGSLWYFIFLGHVFTKVRGGVDEDTFIEELARVVFRDLDPANAPGPKKRRIPG